MTSIARALSLALLVTGGALTADAAARTWTPEQRQAQGERAKSQARDAKGHFVRGEGKVAAEGVRVENAGLLSPEKVAAVTESKPAEAKAVETKETAKPKSFAARAFPTFKAGKDKVVAVAKATSAKTMPTVKAAGKAAGQGIATAARKVASVSDKVLTADVGQLAKAGVQAVGTGVKAGAQGVTQGVKTVASNAVAGTRKGTGGFFASLGATLSRWGAAIRGDVGADLKKDAPLANAVAEDVSHDATKLEGDVAAHGAEVGKGLEAGGALVADVGTLVPQAAILGGAMEVAGKAVVAETPTVEKGLTDLATASKDVSADLVKVDPAAAKPPAKPTAKPGMLARVSGFFGKLFGRAQADAKVASADLNAAKGTATTVGADVQKSADLAEKIGSDGKVIGGLIGDVDPSLGHQITTVSAATTAVATTVATDTTKAQTVVSAL